MRWNICLRKLSAISIIFFFFLNTSFSQIYISEIWSRARSHSLVNDLKVDGEYDTIVDSTTVTIKIHKDWDRKEGLFFQTDVEFNISYHWDLYDFLDRKIWESEFILLDNVEIEILEDKRILLCYKFIKMI